jgi:hypothetical protein
MSRPTRCSSRLQRRARRARYALTCSQSELILGRTCAPKSRTCSRQQAPRPGKQHLSVVSANLTLRSSTSGLTKLSRLPNRPGVAAVSAAWKPSWLGVGLSVALGDSSSLAVALVLDQPGSGAPRRCSAQVIDGSWMVPFRFAW